MLNINLIKHLKNERKIKVFRKNLKVGDKTNEGVVIDINSQEVITKKNQKLDSIYPEEMNY